MSLFRRRHALLPASLLLASAALAPTSAAAAGQPFTCEASLLRGTILTAPAIEPLVANRGKPCATVTAGLPSLATPIPVVQLGVLAANTQLAGPAGRSDLQQAVAAAGIADAKVNPIGALGLKLPLDQIPLPAQLKQITVDISAITGPINNAPVGGAVPTVPGLPVPLPVPTPGVPTATKLPTSITVDIEAAIRELIKLPTADLLGVKAAYSVAGASCVAGKPTTGSQRSVAGVTVLGNAIDVDTFGDRPIVDTQMIDPSQIDLTKVKVPVLDGATGGALSGPVNAAVASALKALPPISLPIDLLRVAIRPGTQTRTADTLRQTALEVRIAVLGQSVLDLVVGDARVGTAGVDCAPPVAAVSPATAKQAPPASVQAPLACTTRRLVLTDVLTRGRRVTITGVADKRLAGRFVTIRFEADGSTAGRALVGGDGGFETTAPLPAKRLRSTNRARYQAVLGREKSLNLKLERRMFVNRLTSADGKVTIAGRVTRPLGRPTQTITLTRRVSCRRSEVVKRFRPRADGSFRVTVPAPQGQTSAVYRLGTKVRKTTGNAKLFPTFTLPQGVDLKQ